MALANSCPASTLALAASVGGPPAGPGCNLPATPAAPGSDPTAVHSDTPQSQSIPVTPVPEPQAQRSPTVPQAAAVGNALATPDAEHLAAPPHANCMHAPSNDPSVDQAAKPPPASLGNDPPAAPTVPHSGQPESTVVVPLPDPRMGPIIPAPPYANCIHSLDGSPPIDPAVKPLAGSPGSDAPGALIVQPPSDCSYAPEVWPENPKGEPKSTVVVPLPDPSRGPIIPAPPYANCMHSLGCNPPANPATDPLATVPGSDPPGAPVVQPPSDS